MASVGLTKTYNSTGTIAARRLVKFGANDNEVVQAAAATDSILGASTDQGSASGERQDVILAGIADVEFGGSVTRGALVTSDANGKAVAAAPSAGSNVRVVGVALANQASGDIGPVLLTQGSMQG